MRLSFAILTLFGALSCAACGSPPDKEMNQARGAIAAAQAAGAEQYAPADFKSAVDALHRAEAAVGQHDYRQALSDALDSREQAEAAALAAGEQKALARSALERELGQAATLLEQVNVRLQRADAGRTTRRAAASERRRVQAAASSVQEARTKLEQGDYLAGRKVLDGVSEALQAAIGRIDLILQPKPPVRRRQSR